MSKSISFRDLQLATILKGLNELQMIHPDNDEKMRWVMSQCGIDVEYDIEYIPCLHRDMQNKVAVGFLAVGELNINRHVLNSVVCDVTDRLVAAGMQDPSLAKELAGMLSSRADYRHLNEDTDAVDIEEDSGRGRNNDDDVEDTYDYVSAQIRQLEKLRDEIRGKK
jgi:hypothetical protein